MMRAASVVPPAALRIGQLAVTAVLAALLWAAADGPAILALLSGANPLWLLAAVAVLMCQTVLSALRWKITAARLGQALPLGHAIREYFLSQVVNQALPGAVVGDAARAVRARAGAGLAIAGQAVLFERLAGQLAMFLTMTLAFGLTYLLPGGLDWPLGLAAPIGVAVLVGVAILVLLLVMARGPARVARLVRPFHHAVLARDVLAAQIVLGAAITLCNLAAFALCALAVGVVLPAAAVFAMVPVVLFAMLVPLTVSGWGVREGAAAVVLPLAAISPSQAVAASVMFGIAMLIAVLPGLGVAGAK